MCGLAGILDRLGSIEPHELQAMAQRIHHRGPDGSGIEVRPTNTSGAGGANGTSAATQQGHLGLAHARLAILDIAGGVQPMSNADQSIWVSFNGEIYNHHELAAPLRSKYDFRTRCDTEVLLHLYAEHGEGFIDQLRGFFAFALWDEPRGRLILARDPIGKKPLFWTRASAGLSDSGEPRERIVFGSELRAVLEALPHKPEVDPLAVDDVLAVRYTRGRRSGYKGIEKLLPGEYLVFDDQGMRRERCGSPPRQDAASRGPRNASGDEQHWLQAFRSHFDAAVARRLEADVPLGLLLSGGLDSTAVLESASRVSAEPLHTFSVAFSRSKESEATYARAAAEHFGARHVEFQLEERELVEQVEGILGHLDEPFGDPSFLPTVLICERAKSEVTVCLGGDGGDELFGGYNRYAQLAQLPKALPSALQPLARGLRQRLSNERGKTRRWRARLDDRLESTRMAYVRRLISSDSELRRRLYGPQLLESLAKFVPGSAEIGRVESELLAELDEIKTSSDSERWMAHDLQHYLPGLILTKTDRASMARSLELRAPFLDRDFITWSLGVPLDQKMKRRADGSIERKHLIRRSLRGRVPDDLLDRKKQGFGTPLGRWFRQDLYDFAHQSFERSQLEDHGLVDGRALLGLLQDHRKRRANHGETLWTLLALEMWLRRLM